MANLNEFPIHLEPAQRLIHARAGESILAAAQRHGVHIDSSCGGAGSCLQCRVSVITHSPRLEGSSESNLVGMHGRALKALDESRTPAGEEQGCHRTFLSCSIGARGPLHIRVEPRGRFGARNHRPSLIGQCAIPEQWNADSWRGPGQVEIRVLSEVEAGYQPVVSVRIADFTILDIKLVRAHPESEKSRRESGKTVVTALRISGDGLAALEMASSAVLDIGDLQKVVEPMSEREATLHALMMRGCYAGKRKRRTLYWHIGPATIMTFRDGVDAMARENPIASIRRLTPVLSGTATGLRPTLVPLLDGAIEAVEFTPMTPRAILTTVGDVAPSGMTASGLWEFIGAAMMAGTLGEDGSFRPCRALKDGPDGKEYVLCSPDVAAMSPSGSVWNSIETVAVSERTVKAFLGELSSLVEASAEWLGDNTLASAAVGVVIAGGHGFHPARNMIQALGIEQRMGHSVDSTGSNHLKLDGMTFESVGDAVSLGAAMVALEYLDEMSVTEQRKRHSR